MRARIPATGLSIACASIRAGARSRPIRVCAIADNQNSLKAGLRGPTLLEDFILREKITHFDHERIPERIVHARGSAAHGSSSAIGRSRDLTRASSLPRPASARPCSSDSRRSRASAAPRIRRETFAASP